MLRMTAHLQGLMARHATSTHSRRRRHERHAPTADALVQPPQRYNDTSSTLQVNDASSALQRSPARRDEKDEEAEAGVALWLSDGGVVTAMALGTHSGAAAADSSSPSTSTG